MTHFRLIHLWTRKGATGERWEGERGARGGGWEERGGPKGEGGKEGEERGRARGRGPERWREGEREREREGKREGERERDEVMGYFKNIAKDVHHLRFSKPVAEEWMHCIIIREADISQRWVQWLRVRELRVPVPPLGFTSTTSGIQVQRNCVEIKLPLSLHRSTEWLKQYNPQPQFLTSFIAAMMFSLCFLTCSFRARSCL